jgi:hypothetical protein
LAVVPHDGLVKGTFGGDDGIRVDATACPDDKHELIASVACDQVVGPEPPAPPADNGRKDHVSDAVAVVVAGPVSRSMRRSILGRSEAGLTIFGYSRTVTVTVLPHREQCDRGRWRR